VAKLVHLRPVIEAELDLLELLYLDPGEASQYGFFGYQDPGGLRRGFAEKGFISEDHGRLAVTLGCADEAGEFSWHIGIGLLARARGQGYGT
jgi:hypothetical protein